MLKKRMKSIFIGIAIATTLFSMTGVVFDLLYGGTYVLQNYQYSKMFLGAVSVGLGFSLPSFIYENERLPFPLQIIFHMGIGCAVLLITSFLVGWFPTKHGMLPLLLAIVGELAVSFALWKCFAMFYKKEADSINQKLNGMSK